MLCNALDTLLQELRAAAEKAQEACGSLEIDGAIDHVHQLRRELEEARKAARMGGLVPLPGETTENCAMQLGTNSKTVGSSMAQLLTAAAQVNNNACSAFYHKGNLTNVAVSNP